MAVLVFDTPDSPVNVLSSALFDEFGRMLDAIASEQLDAVNATLLFLARQINN